MRISCAIFTKFSRFVYGRSYMQYFWQTLSNYLPNMLFLLPANCECETEFSNHY